MSSELEELKEIRTLKSDNQQQLVSQLEQELTDKGAVLDLINQTMEMYKVNKAKMETALFSEIEGQEVDSDDLNLYAEKMKELTAYGDQLEEQYETMKDERVVAENNLEKARGILIECRNDVEKISLLVEEEQKKESIAESKKEDDDFDEQASVQWNMKG